jgi:hypothetical protein
MKIKDPTNSGGGQKGPSDTDKQLAKLQMQKLALEIKQASKIPEAPTIPTAPKPELVAPPPTQTSQDTEAAARELRKNMAKRRGIQRSRLSTSLGAQSVLGGASKLGISGTNT